MACAFPCLTILTVVASQHGTSLPSRISSLYEAVPDESGPEFAANLHGRLTGQIKEPNDGLAHVRELPHVERQQPFVVDVVELLLQSDVAGRHGLLQLVARGRQCTAEHMRVGRLLLLARQNEPLELFENRRDDLPKVIDVHRDHRL